MKTNEAITILKRHNEWRRGADIPMTDVTILGEAIDCVVDYFADADKIDNAFRNPTWKDNIINKAVNWISANACKYVKMNKELIWASADLNDDFRKFLEDTIDRAEIPTNLTWQDVRRIVRIADDFINHTEPTTTEEEYYEQVLKAFNNGKD